jgi:hypothetical protein
MSPIGPTDIRVKNLSDVPMTNVTVNTFDSTFNYGALGPGDTTAYHRFDRAYTKAYITASINGLTFKTDTVYYTYLHYLSTVKATYELYIKNEAQRKLEISNVILESELK